MGNAISGAIWTAHLPKKLALYLPDAAKGSAFLIFGNLTMATSYPMGSPERMAINRSYQETMDKLLIVAACFAVPLFPLSLMMRNYNLAKVCSISVPLGSCLFFPTPVRYSLAFYYYTALHKVTAMVIMLRSQRRRHQQRFARSNVEEEVHANTSFPLEQMDQKVRGNVIGQSAAGRDSASPEVGASNGAPTRGYKTFMDRFRKT